MMEEQPGPVTDSAGNVVGKVVGGAGEQTLRLVPRPSDHCAVCETTHEPDQPHDPDSLYWQIAFSQQHGRYPTMVDAVAHCTEDVQRRVFDILVQQGRSPYSEYQASVAGAEARRTMRESEGRGE